MKSKQLTNKESEYAFISDLLIKLASMPAGEDIGHVLIKGLKEYINASLVMLSIYDPISKTLKIVHVEAQSSLINIAKKILGERIFSTEMAVTDDIHESVLKNYVLKYETLSSITYGTTPAIFDKTVKNLLGISCFYGMSHVFNNELFGTTLLAFHEQQPEPNIGFLEAFGHLTAVILRRNIAEKKLNRLVAENRKVILQLERLNYWKTEEKEKERAMIVNILREETGQTLSALKMDAGWMLENLDDQSACREKLQRMTANIDNSIYFIHKVTNELFPSVLDYMGIRSAIEWVGKEFEKKTDVKIRLIIDVDEMDKRFELACFRIIEEALDNISKHAKASNVKIVLKQNKKKVTLSIIDDGIGISAEKLKTEESLGIIEMHHRAKMLGGELSVSSDNGTVIKASFPR